MKRLPILLTFLVSSCGGNTSTDAPSGSGGDSTSSGGQAAGGGAEGVAGSGGTQTSCEDLAAAAAVAMEQTRSEIDECSADTDCATANIGGLCLNGCIVAVPSSSVELLESSARELCQRYLDSGCEPVSSPCLHPGTLVCQDGVCQRP